MSGNTNATPEVCRPPTARLHRSPVAGDVSQGNIEIVGDDSPRTCHCKRLKTIDSLPDDLLSRILATLPAQDIYDHARLVCRKWYNIIRTYYFARAHLQDTPYGLLIQCYSSTPPLSATPFFLSLRRGQVEISNHACKMRYRIHASCDGLVMGFDMKKVSTIHIVNSVTNKIFTLPPFLEEIACKHLCGIAFAPVSMEYKAVVTYCMSMSEKQSNWQQRAPWNRVDELSKRLRCAILTVGVDKSWRNVDIRHLSLASVMALLVHSPIINEGFIHWVRGYTVLTLNIQTEIITETSPPFDGNTSASYYMPTGSYLSLLVKRGMHLWQVWEMKPEIGEWRKLPNCIDLEAQKCKIKELLGSKEEYYIVEPSGWLKYPEVLIFSRWDYKNPFIFFYNLVTQEIGSINLPEFSGFGPHGNIVLHKNTLVQLCGC